MSTKNGEIDWPVTWCHHPVYACTEQMVKKSKKREGVRERTGRCVDVVICSIGKPRSVYTAPPYNSALRTPPHPQQHNESVLVGSGERVWAIDASRGRGRKCRQACRRQEVIARSDSEDGRGENARGKTGILTCEETERWQCQLRTKKRANRG